MVSQHGRNMKCLQHRIAASLLLVLAACRPSDGSAPQVEVQSPANGATVSGTVGALPLGVARVLGLAPATWKSTLVNCSRAYLIHVNSPTSRKKKSVTL